MDDGELIAALAECLEALRQGEADLEACLKRHASYRTELEALLDVVRLIPRLAEEIRPSPAFRELTRRRLLGRPNGNPPSSGLEWRGADFPYV